MNQPSCANFFSSARHWHKPGIEVELRYPDGLPQAFALYLYCNKPVSGSLSLCYTCAKWRTEIRRDMGKNRQRHKAKL